MDEDITWVSLRGTFDPSWGRRFQLFEPFLYRAQVEQLAPAVRRTLSIEGSVREVASERHGSTALRSRTPFDHGGHLIAARFGGPTCSENLVPMHGAINQSGGRWFRMEDEIAKLLDQRRGHMLVRVLYDDVSLRSHAFHVDVARHDGRRSSWHMENGSPLLLDPRDPEHWRACIGLRLREKKARLSKTARQRVAECHEAAVLRGWYERIEAGERPADVLRPPETTT